MGSLTTGLMSLQSADDIRILDIIDQIRKLGIQELELPQLVVCGSQSAGKSSVLEAISGYPFPRAEMTCTRFVTQISFRRADVEQIHVSISPDKSRPEHERQRLQQESSYLKNPDPQRLPELIRVAESKLGLSGNKAFSKDVLSIQISGPKHRPLTLVDLPGLIEADAKNKDNIELIRSLVDEWIVQKGSIILAVVEAKNDAQTMGILTRAQAVDPRGERTFGIITKPDLVRAVGERLEDFWIDHAMNKTSGIEFPLKQGWHTLRNRNYEEMGRATSSEIRDQKEREFFTTDKKWSRVDPRYWGIDTLRQRLQSLLTQHTKRQLPRLRSEIRGFIDQYHEEFAALEKRLQQPEKLWKEFEKKCFDMSHTTKASVDGKYNNDRLASIDVFQTNDRLMDRSDNLASFLRSRIRNEADDFQQQIAQNGHGISFGNLEVDSQLYLQRLEMEMQQILNLTRGEELPGHHDPQRLNILYWRLSSKWHGMALDYLEKSHEHCRKFVQVIIDMHLQDAISGLPLNVLNRVRTNLDKALQNHRMQAREELSRLEEDRIRAPRTQNMSFELQSRRRKYQRLQSLMTKAMHKAEQDAQNVPAGQPGVTPGSIERSIGQDVKSSSITDITADTLIYYHISRDTFVDNVVVQVVERHLLRDLHELFYGTAGITHDDFFVELDDEQDLKDRRARMRSLQDDIQTLEGHMRKLES